MENMKFGNITCVELIDLINLVRKKIAEHEYGKEAMQIVKDLKGIVEEFVKWIYAGAHESVTLAEEYEARERERVLDSFTIRKSLRMNYDLKDTGEIANEFTRWIVGLGSRALKLADDYEKQARAK